MTASLAAYRAVTRCATPLLPRYLARRAARGKEIADRLGERFGIAGAARPEGRLVWVHAASMGETMSVLALIDRLAEATSVLLTTGTVTSAQLAGARARAIHQFVPLDAPRHVARFLDHWRPDTAVFVESEIWPNMLTGLDARRIPRALVNAALSPRSAAAWTRLGPTARTLFGGFAFIDAQSAADTTRFARLGIPCSASGNLKFAAPPLPDDAAARASLAAAIPGPRLLAASTHDGEDRAVIEAHRSLLRRFPDLATIIVPRHPERAASIAALAPALMTRPRSAGGTPAPGRIHLADTLGELGLFYRLCPIALIGGTLAPIGGHNVIEPARLGCAVLIGPADSTIAEATAALERAGALARTNANCLGADLGALLADPARVAAMGAAGARLCSGFDALPDRLAARILDLIR